MRIYVKMLCKLLCATQTEGIKQRVTYSFSLGQSSRAKLPSEPRMDYRCASGNQGGPDYSMPHNYNHFLYVPQCRKVWKLCSRTLSHTSRNWSWPTNSLLWMI